MSSLIGRTLGQYKVTETLGQGGMATVYRGYQESVDRDVAIKVLPPHPGLNEQFKERFRLEARTIGGLQHPHILPLYDYGAEDDVLYLVMAYVEGGTLGDIMDGSLNIREVEGLLRGIADGLDYAHRRGIIHRDIKPANILLNEGHPLLADFGLVRMTASSSDLTGTAIVGTPAYMAPEQGQGLSVDSRADVYALGAMVYEMLTGEPPYMGDTPMQTILAHINKPIPDILELRPDLPPAIKQVFETVLAKSPDERYATAGQFAEAFTAAVHGTDESLAETRRAYPIQSESQVRQDEPPTTQFIRPSSPDSGSQSQPQTVILRDGTNPYVLMGGFGLIALVIVVVAVLLINQQPAPAAVLVATEDDSATIVTEQVVANEPTEIPIPTVGEVRYSTTNALGDTLNLRLNEIQPTSEGSIYVAWLQNTITGDILSLGAVTVDAFGEGGLIHTAEDGTMLPANYNALLITAEVEVSDSLAGEVAYSAFVPAEVMSALTEIFVTSENGIDAGSLIDGAKAEVATAVRHAGLAAGAGDIGGVRTHFEHTINIIKGEQEDYNGNERGENPGQGIGVFFFLDAIETTLNRATTQANASVDLQVNADTIRVCAENVRFWSNQMVTLGLNIITKDDLASIQEDAAQVVEISGHLTAGFDANGRDGVEPFEGECGLDQIPAFGLQFGNMTVTEGGLGGG